MGHACKPGRALFPDRSRAFGARWSQVAVGHGLRTQVLAGLICRTAAIHIQAERYITRLDLCSILDLLYFSFKPCPQTGVDPSSGKGHQRDRTADALAAIGHCKVSTYVRYNHRGS
jgi:hypothetical protein